MNWFFLSVWIVIILFAQQKAIGYWVAFGMTSDPNVDEVNSVARSLGLNGILWQLFAMAGTFGAGVFLMEILNNG
mgnify:FL=1